MFAVDSNWPHRLVRAGSLLLQTPPDPRQHTRRSYGAYSNRSRATARVTQDFAGPTAQSPRADEDSEFTKDARRTWARLLAKIFELDPMLCSCGAEMKIVSVITDARVVARILRHLESERCKARDPFEPRAPPRPAALSH